jgi:acetyl-CoA C-acetyltransferase
MTDELPIIPPNTPILIGVAAVQQKLEQVEDALEPIALMELALRSAAVDALPGNGDPTEILRLADEIMVPKGIWSYSDPGRLLADALGAESVQTVLADIGVSQQTLINRACQRIADGESQMVLVTGAEAKYRALCAKKAGVSVQDMLQEELAADVVLEPDSELWSPVESAAGLGMPVGYYAIIDSALRYKQQTTVSEHRDLMADMYARFSEIAAANPDAWADQALGPEAIREPSPANRMLAWPYTKLHNSQWNVDQGAGMIFCSAAMAKKLEIPRGKWIFPRASTEANFSTVVAARKDLGGSPGFRVAGEVALELAGLSFDDIALLELYSCFPAAVRVQLQEFGLSPAGELSVTGGMTFGGGPLNNFVLQATVKMAQLLRERPGEVGLVTTVSGMLTKQACALWSTAPNPGGWAFSDVTAQVGDQYPLCEVVAEYSGSGTVAGYTVLYQGHAPWRAVAIFDLPGDQRTVAYNEEKDILDTMLGEECCGRKYNISEGQFSTGSLD